MEPLFLKGVFKEKIWGGSKLRKEFNYDIPSNKTGSLWAISAHPNGPAMVINGPYKGKTLNDLWKNHRELFGEQEGDVFPLLTKIIDAQEDLSVQVHPDDAYGLKNEGELGKTECWYILAADPGSKVIYGHYAETKDKLIQEVNNKNWENLLRNVEVEAGDFLHIPSGTVHAIGSGIMILETQQSSDTTYRLYDYDRRDVEGDLRDLHIKKSIDVSTVPHQDYVSPSKTQASGKSLLKTLVSTDFFTVYKWIIEDSVHFKRNSLYTLVSVINGRGELYIKEKSYPIEKGDHFILPYVINEWELDGNLEIIASHP